MGKMSVTLECNECDTFKPYKSGSVTAKMPLYQGFWGFYGPFVTIVHINHKKYI